jgi:hypothetical protein
LNDHEGEQATLNDVLALHESKDSEPIAVGLIYEKQQAVLPTLPTSSSDTTSATKERDLVPASTSSAKPATKEQDTLPASSLPSATKERDTLLREKQPGSSSLHGMPTGERVADPLVLVDLMQFDLLMKVESILKGTLTGDFIVGGTYKINGVETFKLSTGPPTVVLLPDAKSEAKLMMAHWKEKLMANALFPLEKCLVDEKVQVVHSASDIVVKNFLNKAQLLAWVQDRKTKLIGPTSTSEEVDGNGRQLVTVVAGGAKLTLDGTTNVLTIGGGLIARCRLLHEIWPRAAELDVYLAKLIGVVGGQSVIGEHMIMRQRHLHDWIWISTKIVSMITPLRMAMLSVDKLSHPFTALHGLIKCLNDGRDDKGAELQFANEFARICELQKMFGLDCMSYVIGWMGLCCESTVIIDAVESNMMMWPLHQKQGPRNPLVGLWGSGPCYLIPAGVGSVKAAMEAMKHEGDSYQDGCVLDWAERMMMVL